MIYLRIGLSIAAISIITAAIAMENPVIGAFGCMVLITFALSMGARH